MYLKRTMTLSNNFSSSSSDHSLFPDFSCTSTYFAGESKGGEREGGRERGREREREGGEKEGTREERRGGEEGIEGGERRREERGKEGGSKVSNRTRTLASCTYR